MEGRTAVSPGDPDRATSEGKLPFEGRVLFPELRKCKQF